MKRILIPFFVAVFVAACVREEPQPAEPVQAGADGADRVTRAYIVQPGKSRTDFDSYVGKFAWSEGDQIAIHLSDGTFYETPVNAGTGAFTCSTTSSKQRNAYAVFPASARDASNYGSPTLNVVLPAEYDISGDLASDYSPVPMVAVNRQEEDDLYFRHIGGLLRITCDRVPANSRYIAVTFDRNVAGTFTVVNPASDNPTISSGGDSPTVTFRIAADKLTERTDGIILNVPVPTGDISSIKIAALDAYRTEIRSSTRDLSLSLPRGHGKKIIGNIIPAYTDSMQLVITAGDETGWEFKFPFGTDYSVADLTVSWGDGTFNSVNAGSYSLITPLTHTYSEAGEYIITVTGTTDSKGAPMIQPLRFDHSSASVSARTMLKAVPTPLLPMQDGTSAYQMFRRCTNLESVCGDLFSKNPGITNFNQAFYLCTKLKAIPEDLFSYTPEATTFASVFGQCASITGIPDKLFANNPAARDFSEAFYQCNNLKGSIPSELFANNPLARNFQYTFWYYTSLSGSIPASLFAANPKAEIFGGTFCGCSGLTGSIPANLFANNSEATNFYCTFSGCSGLTGSIPESLFANNPKVTTFRETFNCCTALSGSIPENLFANNPLVQSFYYTFTSCNKLTGTIPEGLFANNSQVKGNGFEHTFAFCEGLSGGIPSGLFAVHTLVTDFEQTFMGCTGLTGEIPQSLFENNTSVTNFIGTFQGCSNLSVRADVFTGETYTPATRFAHLTSQLHVERCFYGTSGGTAPELWSSTYTYGAGVDGSGCFYSISPMSNDTSIPLYWKQG